ncbi:cell division protein ZipA C-terminal FtsZ-binding domain-containing protein [Niveibacterium sp. SC-1]|uniref:cell division protein ZipA C-terminal FtsZ-binding domain-containing protein n=1 Tax=Niveibacterium sp. SC-1 TaxID=3135646 RepID=UPI00311EA62F
MPDNELLYGLIGLGTAAVVLVLGYNALQERKHRRAAERAFRSEHRDVLLEGDATPETEQAPPVTQRREPAASRVPPAAPIGRAAEPELPADAQAVDCVIRIEAPAGLIGGQIVTAAGGPLAQLNRPIRWYGFGEDTFRWQTLEPQDPASYTRVTVAMQVADRRGPISAHELEIFVSAIQRVCDQFMAVPRIAERDEILALAQNVDQFCAAVDIQIALSVVAGEQAFPGTKLRGLAQAAGLVLERDGCFHARDDQGETLFVLANRDPALFSNDALREMVSTGVTLSLDVPRVAAGGQVFDRMVTFARQLAAALHGTVVDDNRRPLSDASIGLIRNQVTQFQEQMQRQGIPAGSELAQRLFV